MADHLTLVRLLTLGALLALAWLIVLALICGDPMTVATP